MTVSSDDRWAPRHSGLIGATAFVLLVVFNKSVIKVPYLEWVAGAAVAVLVVLFILARGRIVKGELMFVVLPFLWIVYALLITPISYNPTHHSSRLLLVGALVAISVFVIASAFRRERMAAKVAGTTVLVWVILNFFLFIGDKTGRIPNPGQGFSGIFENRNEFAMQTVILSSLLFFTVKTRWFVWLLMVPSGILVIASLSIKGVVCFLFFPVYAIFLRVSLVKRMGLIVFLMSSAIGVYSAVPDFKDRVDRFGMVFNDYESLRKSESAFLRVWLASSGYGLIMENPLSGVGVDNSKFLMIPPVRSFVEKGKGLDSHNNYIEMALNCGIPGLFLFYFPLLYVWLNANKSHKYYAAINTWVMLYMLSGLVMVQYDNFISILLYVFPLFYYFYHKQVRGDGKNSVHRFHASAHRANQSAV